MSSLAAIRAQPVVRNDNRGKGNLTPRQVLLRLGAFGRIVRQGRLIIIIIIIIIVAPLYFLAAQARPVAITGPRAAAPGPRPSAAQPGTPVQNDTKLSGRPL